MTNKKSIAPSIDVHTHLAPKLHDSELATLRLSKDIHDRYELNGNALGPRALYDAQLLIDYLATANVDEAFVSVPPPFFQQDLTLEAATHWFNSIARGIVDACAADSRLHPLVHLPLEHPSLATQIARQYLGESDIAGWSAGAGGKSTALDSPELSELWGLLAADGRPVLLHPASTPDKRLDPYYLHNLLGNPVETGVAVGELVFGGVLDRLPQLKLVLVHCGGVVPSVASRWQHGFDTARPSIDTSLTPVKDTLRKFYTDCLTHDSANVELARRVFGDSQLLLGSDWPFPMGLTDPRAPISHLDAEIQENIARDNPRRLKSLLPDV